MRWRWWAVMCLLAASASAQTGTFTFEGFTDSTVLTNQYPGLTFTNAILLGAGITLDEFEFPPHSGSNVASDNGGPMSISFLWPVRGLIGYFTYSVPLSIQAFGASNNAVGSVASTYSNNEALSGVSGSQPNQMISFTATAGIYKIVITGSAQGTSFTVDDLSPITYCDLNEDGATNVADVQAIVNEALGAQKPVDDLNSDGVVNAVDLQIEINAALGLGCTGK